MSIYNPTMKKYIVDSLDYWAALNMDGGVRIGLRGVNVYILPPEHRATSLVMKCKTSDDVEAIHDDFTSGAYGKFKYVA